MITLYLDNVRNCFKFISPIAAPTALSVEEKRLMLSIENLNHKIKGLYKHVIVCDICSWCDHACI